MYPSHHLIVQYNSLLFQEDGCPHVVFKICRQCDTVVLYDQERMFSLCPLCTIEAHDTYDSIPTRVASDDYMHPLKLALANRSSNSDGGLFVMAYII